jgi:hypothetical protein
VDRLHDRGAAVTALYGLEYNPVAPRSERAIVRLREVMDGRYRAPICGDRNRG